MNTVRQSQFAKSALQAQKADTATSASFASIATSSSYASIAMTASYALTASYVASSSYSTSSYNAVSASFATTASYSVTSSYILNATSASFSSTASYLNPLRQNVNVYGNLMVTGNLNVLGTASFTYTTQSIVNVGAGFINLNTDYPAARYGGMNVIDSGSFGNSSTGSLLWDSLYNRWIYANPSGSSYDGGMLISGPRNTSGLGNEQGTTLNSLMKGQGADHITSSGVFEDASGNVGIKTATPAYTLDVSGSFRTINTASFGGLSLFNQNRIDNVLMVNFDTTNNYYQVGKSGNDLLIRTAANNLALFAGKDTTLQTGAIGGHFYFKGGNVNGFGQSNFSIADYNGSNTRFFVSGSGNVGIGTITPANTLDVSGSARVKGVGTTTGVSLNVQNGSGLDQIKVYDSGIIGFYSNGITNATGVRINSVTGLNTTGLNLYSDGIFFNQTGFIRFSQTSAVTSTGAIRIQNQSTAFNPTTATTATELGIGSTFAPTSGVSNYTSLLLDPIISQSGGANGITRGLYINPTLTSTFDFRAIETTTGSIILNGGNVGVGTSAPGTKLDVVGAIRTSTIVYTNNVFSSAASNTFLNLNGTTNVSLGLHNANMPFIIGVTLGNEIMRVSGSGNVGIGTSNPTNVLHLVNSSSATFRIQNVGGSSADFSITAGNGRLEMVGNNASSGRITISQFSKNIGINNQSPIYNFDVSGSGNFNSGLTITGSLTSPSITGSLQGTASYTLNAISSSFASTASYVNPLIQNITITGSLTTFGTTNIIDTIYGTLLTNNTNKVDWQNGVLVTSTGNNSIDWENYALIDSNSNPSIDWNGRNLTTIAGNTAFEYATTVDDYVSTNLYLTQFNPSQIQRNLSENILFSGHIIAGTVNAGVLPYQPIYLDTDGIWYNFKNLTGISSKMLGIYVDGNILLEGDMTVSDNNTVGTYVVGADHGLPIYLSETTGQLSTTIPSTGVVRVVGHIYYQNPTNTNVWLMKFRPSNDWYEI